MNFIIDVGNTFAKLAVYQEYELIQKKKVPLSGLENGISEIISEFREIRAAIVSNVSNQEFAFPQEYQDKFPVMALDSKTNLPFKNFYATPETLGNDRKALVAAASRSYPSENVLIIDAGTCITYDFKNSSNEYLGGAISPGLEMRLKALHHFTGRLPLVEKSRRMKLIGSTTKSSIATGVEMGVVKEVDGFINEYLTEYQKVVIIITGGDGQFLSINLKNTIFANSNFLLEGLNYILEINSIQWQND